MYISRSFFCRSNFIFHATDPETNSIVDFDDFFMRLTEAEGDKDGELIGKLSTICPVEKITVIIPHPSPPTDITFSIVTAGLCQHQ